ncbi:MAG: hypothetical protein QNJ98_16285 [Planctomycetota bacterium]|nr:hypothetical protein [Planctomycetota bacterium]
MDKLAVILAIVAVALGGYAAFGKTEEGSSGSYDTSVSDLADRIATLEAENEEYKKLLGVGGPMAVDAEAGADAAEPGTNAAAALKGRSHLAVPKRVADLEARLADYDQRFADMEAKKAEEKKDEPWKRASRFFGKNKFLANLDQAEKALDLDSSQRAQLDRIIDTTKAELERLYDTPNDEGKTLKELMKPATINLSGDADSNIVSLMGNLGKVRKFKQSKVPGTNETYAEAEKRIRDAGKRDARGLLNEDQQKKWDDSHTSALFSPPGAMTGSVVTFSEAVPVPGK